MPFRMQSTAMPQLTGAYASAVPGLAQLGIAQQQNERQRLLAAIREFGASRARNRAIRRGGEGDAAGGAAAGAASGASIGTGIVPGIGTAIGAGIGAIAGGVIGHNTPQGGGAGAAGQGGTGAMLKDLGSAAAQIAGGFKGMPGEGQDALPLRDETYRRSTGGIVGEDPGVLEARFLEELRRRMSLDFSMPGGSQANPFASWASGAVTGQSGGGYPLTGSLGMGMP